MYSVFLVLHFAGLVATIIFFNKSRKLKKAGANNADSKKKMLISLAVWLVAFVMVGVTAPKTENTETESATTATETEAVTEATTEAVTEPAESEIETTAAPEITEDEFMQQVKNAVDDSIGQDEKIEGITLENRVLTITDDITEEHKNMQIELPIEDLAVSNASAITDSILELDTSFWDKIVIDFKGVGTVTRTTEDIVDSEYGRYFEISYLDGQEPETTGATSNPIPEEDKTYLIVMAKNIIEKYVDKPKYPWGTSAFNVIRFDDKDAIMVYTDQLSLKTSDFKQSAYVVFTYYPDQIKDFKYTEHYCEVAGVKLSDDGYCDEFFDKLSALQ